MNVKTALQLKGLKPPNMIDIKVLASGSSGNAYKISDSTTTILIEAGISLQKIREAFNFKLSSAAACLITHEHGDHSKAVKDIMRAGIDCYMSNGTAEAIGASGHRLKVVKSKELFAVGSFKVLPFDTQHDAKEPLGFLLQSYDGEKLLFATDTYYIKYRFSGLTYVMLECNYSKEILEENIKVGVVPKEIRNRIVRSHFELDNVKAFLAANDLSNVRKIYLIHLSQNNGEPELFKTEIQKAFGKPVYIGGDT